MVEGIARRGNVGNTRVCVVRSEPGLSHSKNVYCLGNDQIRKGGVFSRVERMLVVARRMLCLTTGPGFRLTSPASSSIKANLNVCLELGSNLTKSLRRERLYYFLRLTWN